MNFALVYLAHRAIYRFLNFFHHWYADGSRNFAHSYISFLEKLDQTFAVRVTFRYLFQPLYKDFSIIGRILGIIFRSGRILIALVFYSIFTLLFLIVYLVWLLLPPFLILYAASQY
ncbi:MAG: hypothetical protein Q7K44_05250 [Candidatus Liptonbacteria bacterium]|nr:hypothetical protein [Candidatus Liptonbacteria bacterium]